MDMDLSSFNMTQAPRFLRLTSENGSITLVPVSRIIVINEIDEEDMDEAQTALLLDEDVEIDVMEQIDAVERMLRGF